MKHAKCQSVLENIGYKGIIPARIVDLKYTTRNINSLIQILVPYTVEENASKVYLWVTWDGIRCRIYRAKGTEYMVEKKLVKVSDMLSGLKHKIPLAYGLVDGKPVWESVWKGSRYGFRFLIGSV